MTKLITPSYSNLTMTLSKDTAPRLETVIKRIGLFTSNLKTESVINSTKHVLLSLRNTLQKTNRVINSTTSVLLISACRRNITVLTQISQRLVLRSAL